MKLPFAVRPFWAHGYDNVKTTPFEILRARARPQGNKQDCGPIKIVFAREL
jgi:hypothetical protein